MLAREHTAMALREPIRPEATRTADIRIPVIRADTEQTDSLTGITAAMAATSPIRDITNTEAVFLKMITARLEITGLMERKRKKRNLASP